MSNPALFSAFLLLAVLTALRDLDRLSLGSAALLGSAIALAGALAGLFTALVNRAARSWGSGRWVSERRVERESTRVFHLASVLPWTLGLLLVARGDDVPSLVPLVLAVAGAAQLVAGRALSGRLSAARRTATALWLVVLTLGLAATHEATGTFLSVRAGTERLHLLLFAGTACLVTFCGLVPALTDTLRGRSRLVVLATSIAVGALCLEADRRALVGLYPFVHALLGAQGLLLVALGVAGLLPHGARARKVDLGALVALAIVGSICVVFGPRLADSVRRAELHSTALGATLLELLPVAGRGSVGAAMHPALGYPRHFDSAPLEERPNILLITVDALRPDALAEMPFVSSLGKESVVFTRAYAQGTRTAIGVGTLLTGRYSALMDWRLWAYQGGHVVEYDKLSSAERAALGKRTLFTTVPLVPRGVLLAERLRAVGYATSAVPFAGKNEFFRGDLVFARGFDQFQDLTEKGWAAPTSPKLAELTVQALSRGQRTPWFHWAHFYDPHESKRDRKRYAEYARLVDDAVARIVRQLRESGAWERTALVLTADHGEAFGEHRHEGHGTSLYEEQVRVPLLMRIPGIAAAVAAEPVAAIDATATLASMTGASTKDLDGTNLLPRLRGDVAAETRPIFVELHRYMSNQGDVTHDFKGVVLGDWKLIWDRRSQSLELFELASDPEETHNVIGARPEQAALLEGILRSFLARAEAEHPLPSAKRD